MPVSDAFKASLGAGLPMPGSPRPGSPRRSAPASPRLELAEEAPSPRRPPMGLGLGALGSESPVFQRRQENARSAAMKQEAQERALAEEEQKRIDAMEPAEQLRHLKKQYHSLCFKYNSLTREFEDSTRKLEQIKKGELKEDHNGIWRKQAVWVNTLDGDIYMAGIPTSPDHHKWQQVHGKAVHVDVNGTWAYCANEVNDLWRHPSDGTGSWEKCEGKMRHVSLSDTHMWGLDPANCVHVAKTDSPSDSMGWQKIDSTPETPKFLAACHAWVYCCTAEGQLWRRENGDELHTEWSMVNTKGKLNCIAASDAFVWCANEHGHAYYAEHAGVPSRTEWARVPGRLEVTKHTISYMDASETMVYILDATGSLFVRDVNGRGDWGRCNRVSRDITALCVSSCEFC